MAWGFIEGRMYNRRRDIHDRFSGQERGGIITPGDKSQPIFLITGEEGNEHGYHDVLRPDGVFEYFGEGQIGDMRMIKGNAAIMTHAEQGRDLLLFRMTKDGLRYLGQQFYEGHQLRQAPDRAGNLRTAIVFELRSHESIEPADLEIEGEDLAQPLDVLRQRAQDAARATPRQGQRTTTVYERSRTICTYVFARAAGHCERCGNPAPFNRPNGTPYLEAHHIRRLTDGGPDDPKMMIGVCPNCHREAHSGARRADVNAVMLAIVVAKEAELG